MKRLLHPTCRRATLLALGVVAASCSLPWGEPEICADNLVITFSPSDTTILVGQSFTAKLTSIAECNGKRPVTDVVRWHADDPSMISVDSISGVVTGLSAGATAVVARFQTYNRLSGVPVTVAAPAP